MKNVIVSVLIIFAFLLPLKAQNVDSGLIDAVTLYSNGNYDRAHSLLDVLKSADPQNDAVWFYLAQTQLQQRDMEGGLESLQKAVSLDSTNFWYRRMLARLHLAQGNLAEGKKVYEKLVEDFPDKQSLPYELLDVYLSSKEYEKALASLDEIQQQRGYSEEVATTRFNIYNAMGRPDKAVEALEDFNKHFSSAQILSMLGDAYVADFADSLAQARYTEALSIDSSYMPAMLGMSEVYRHKRQYPQYFKSLEPFIGSQEVNAKAKSMYIESLSRSIDPKTLQAQRQGFDSLISMAIATSPADTSLYVAAGRYYIGTGRADISEEYFRSAAELSPESMELAITYLQVLSFQQKWAELRDASMDSYHTFDELAFMDFANMASYQMEDYDFIIENSRFIIKRYSKDKSACLAAWATMGDAYGQKQDFKQACKAYDKVLRIDSGHIPTLNNYAYYLSLQGKKLKKAYNMSKKTIEAEPDNATYLDTFAWILHLMGKDLEAKPFFKHAMLYGGKDSAVILTHYAIVLESLGEADAAMVYRNMAKRLEK